MTHSLAAKAALILGLKFRALEVSAEDNFGLRGETLRQAIEEDVTVGNAPFFLSEHHNDAKIISFNQA